MFTPYTSSLRYTLPRVELRANGRRSGAYPTKARTGDRTRTGQNKYYFDDSQTVIFQDNVKISMPTTLPTGSLHLDSDLQSDFFVTGSSRADAVDQWIERLEQVESLGPFVEDKLFEQDEHAVVNSSFMTGAAYAIAPGNFKSGVSSKTVIRLVIPMTQESVLSPNSSSMYYLNGSTGKFDLVESLRRDDYHGYPRSRENPVAITMFDPILFGPFGYINSPNAYAPTNFYNQNLRKPSAALNQINNFVPDGSSLFDPGGLSILGVTSRTNLVTGSLLRTRHSASAQQSIDLQSYLAQPFLVEKVVVEMPFAAGPGWMNDSYAMQSFHSQDPSTAVFDKCIDGGGPMITVGLLRQDGVTPFHRDLIASATFTNAFEVLTASYLLSSHSINDTDNSKLVVKNLIYTRTGLSGTVDPTFVVYGPVLSGSTNFFTGAVRLPMTPAVTHHITRLRLSGTSEIGFYNGGLVTGSFGDSQSSRTNMGDLMTFGSPTRHPGMFESGRSILGNNIALLDASKVDATAVRVKTYEADFEDLVGRQNDTNKTQKAKAYWDLVTATKQSPYLLYPKDKLILCVNKHRAVANSMSFTLRQGTTSDPSPNGMQVRALHDAKFLPGAVTITLYGDLIKEDHEFHDTLNQRLETEELWETVGEEPTLDQFDVVYASEMSGSYVDRFNVFNAVQGQLLELSSSLQSKQYYSNFTAGGDNSTWSSQYAWSNARVISSLKKSNKNVNHISTDERFWDCRVPAPLEAILSCNPEFGLVASIGSSWVQLNVMYTGMTGSSTAGVGINDWIMTYPFESRFSTLTQMFVDNIGTLDQHIPTTNLASSARIYNFGQVTIQYGHHTGSAANRRLASDYSNDGVSTTSGITLPEFIRFFYGIGNGVSPVDNQHVTFLKKRQGSDDDVPWTFCAQVRGWRYGIMNAFPVNSMCVFNRNHFGQFRDMFEQRLDARFYKQSKDNSTTGLLDSPVQIAFYDRVGNPTDSILTLSSNLSTEATSSMPYTDGQARNRSTIDYANLNISPVTF